MKTKLTLHMDEEIIQKAKAFSEQSGKSLSQIVADYFKHLDSKGGFDESELGPVTKSLWGILKDVNVDEDDYFNYLEEKHR